MQFQIAPSILAADFLNLEKDIRALNDCADLIHLDVMDGSFVPNISFGFPIIDAVAGIATIPMDAHLMVVEPWKWFSTLQREKVSMASFHLEAAGDRTSECIRALQSEGIKAGVAVNPDVPVQELFPYIGSADFFLVMSVFAGFGGQKFMPESLERVSSLKAEIRRRGFETPVQIDGGINKSNIGDVIRSGADIVVAGSSVFGGNDPRAAVRSLRDG